jgi:asparagine synthase (glutamine-hydrolysing)
MCGFLLLASTSPERGLPHDPATLDRLRDVLTHRGPDAGESWIDSDRKVALLHRRLKVIDLEGARQPMHSPDGRYHLVYNGEIYNFRELRAELAGKGWSFRTAGDTEVLLAAWATWGLDCLPRLNGIFAFAVWDSRERRLTLARDPLGVKPLYVGWWDGVLYVASEAKAIVADPAVPRRIDPVALDLYFHYGYVPAPWSIWQGLGKLESAHSLNLDLSGEWNGLPEPRRYWDVPYGGPTEEPASEEALLERLDATLKEAVQRQTVSDVPLGAFLSGGVDSSLVVAYLAETNSKVRTFNVGFAQPKYDERSFAREVAERFGTEHHELEVDEASVEMMPELAEAYDEPFADAAALPTALVSKLAREHVTVVLSGDGGDETHAGYPRYVRAHKLKRLDAIPLGLRKVLLGPLVPLARSWRRRGGVEQAIRDEADRYDAITTEVPWSHRRSTYSDAFRAALRDCDSPDVGAGAARWRRVAQERPPVSASTLDRFQYLEMTTYMPEKLLMKVDRASMLVSLEARVPLLDVEAVTFGASIPAGWRMRDGTGKYLLRKLLARRMGEDFVNRRKHPFGVPTVAWFRKLPTARLRELLLADGVDQWLDPSRLERLLFRSRRGLEFLWPYLMFSHWYRRFGGAS